MKKLHLLLLVIVLTCPSIKAQISIDNPGFFYIDNKYVFNLPQLGIGLELPAKSGFKVPLLKGKGVYLNMGDTTSYFLDLNYLSESEHNIFYFNMDGESEEKAMRVMIFKTDRVVDFKAEIDKAAKERKLAIIKSLIDPKLGETVAFRTDFEGKPIDQHNVLMDSLFIGFAFESNISKTTKAKYESIIKSFRKKNLEQELETYRTRLAQKEAEDEAAKYEIEDAKPSETMKYKEGSFDENTNIEWSDLDLRMDIPQGWTYMVQANEDVTISNGKMLLAGNGKEINFFQFRSDSVYVTVNTYGKETEGMKEYYWERQAGNAIYSQSFATTVDGLQVDGLYYGSKSSGTLGIFFEKDDIQYWVSAESATKKTLPIINQIFASIRIGDKNRTQSGKHPFDDLVLEDAQFHEKMEVKDNPLKLSKADTSKAFTCNLSEMGIQFSLMDAKEDFMCSLGGKNIDITSDIKETPIDAAANRLSFYTLKKTLGYGFSKVSKQHDLYQYVSSFITNWSAYKEYVVDTAGVQEINGKKWAICIAQQLGGGFMGMFTTYHRNYEVMVFVASPQRADIIEEARVLETFKFD